MTMTRKDYVLLAEALKYAKPDYVPDSLTNLARREQWERDCTKIAAALRGENPRFDNERFAKACGIDR